MATQDPHGMPRIDRCGRQPEPSSVQITSAVDERFRAGARDFVAACQQDRVSAFRVSHNPALRIGRVEDPGVEGEESVEPPAVSD